MAPHKTALLALVVLLLAGTARADVLYCIDRDRRLRMAMVDHDEYIDGFRPPAIKAWPCTPRLFIQGQPLRSETGYEHATEKTLIAWANDAVLNALQAEAIAAEKRRRGLPQETRLTTRLDDFDALIIAYSFSIFRNEIMAERTLVDRLSKLAFYASYVRATIKIESDGSLTSLSSAGAMGLIQIMPSTIDDVYKGIGPRPNPFKVEDNLLYGIGEIEKKLAKVRGWIRNNLANWQHIVKGPDGKPVIRYDSRGRKHYQTVPRSMSGFNPNNWALYTWMVYNMGVNGWLDWEYDQRQNGSVQNAIRPYAAKGLRYLQTYCPGVDIVKARCATPGPWFQKAMNDPKNLWLTKPRSGGLAR